MSGLWTWEPMRLIHAGVKFDTLAFPYCEALGSPDADGMFAAIDRAGDKHEFNVSLVKSIYGCRDTASCPVCRK